MLDQAQDLSIGRYVRTWESLKANDNGPRGIIREDRTSPLESRYCHFLISRIHEIVRVYDGVDGRIVRPYGNVST